MSERKLIQLVVDAETTVRSNEDSVWGKADPFDTSHRNKMIAQGVLNVDTNDKQIAIKSKLVEETEKAIPYNFDPSTEEFTARFVPIGKEDLLEALPDTKGSKENEILWIGHNLGFDIMFNYRAPGRPYKVPDAYNQLYRLFEDVYVYDTQLAEYALSAQKDKFISLDAACERRFGKAVKDERIKICWENNIQTEDINPAMLCRYLNSDIEETKNLYLSQQQDLLKESVNFNRNLFISNEALLATTLMSMSGIVVDRVKLQKYKLKLEKKLGLLAKNAETLSGRLAHVNGSTSDRAKESRLHTVEDMFSKKKLSFNFFGTPLLLDPESKEASELLPGHVAAQLAGNSTWIHNIDDKILDEIIKFCTPPTLIKNNDTFKQLAEVIKQARECNKMITSYILPILDNINIYDLYHPKLSSVQTFTGRLAGFFQTIPNDKKLKKCIIAPENYSLVSIDFKQIEIICAAILSGDPTLIEDLKAGIDIHATLFQELFHREHTPEERKQFKRVVFAMLYGASAFTAHAQLGPNAGLLLDDVRKIFRGFKTKYPLIEVNNAEIKAYIEDNSQPSRMKSEGGYPIDESIISTISGKKLYFKQYDAPAYIKAKGGDEVTFSPTQAKNYPKQALAADIMKLYLAKVMRVLTNGELTGVVPILTTHDSENFYVLQDSDFYNRVKKLSDIANNMGTYLENWYHINTYDLPFNVDIEFGSNLGEQSTLYISKEIE